MSNKARTNSLKYITSFKCHFLFVKYPAYGLSPGTFSLDLYHPFGWFPSGWCFLPMSKSYEERDPPAVMYQPLYFFSRYPLETTKLWNLTNLLTPASWFAYFITIISVIISLKLSCCVGRKLGLSIITEEIALVPFRCQKFNSKTIYICFSFQY